MHIMWSVKRCWMEGLVAAALLWIAAPIAAGDDAAQPSAGQEQGGSGQVSSPPGAFIIPAAGASQGQNPNALVFQGNISAQNLNVAPQQLNVTPEQVNTLPSGPGEAQGLLSSSGLVAYQPIPESMLPTNVSSAAQAANAQQVSPTTTNLGAPAMNWGPYTLGPDDVVHIAVRNQPEFTGTFVIGHDGKIQMGLLGDIDADELTKEELGHRVEERLKRYVRLPIVLVTIVGFNSKAIYILGRVARPGKYAMRGDSIKIRDAVIAAGLVVQHAKLRQVHIIKSDPDDPSFKIIDLQKVLYKGQMKDNVDLVAGDIVVVPTTIWGGINDFLNSLLSPVGHAGSVAALAAL